MTLKQKNKFKDPIFQKHFESELAKFSKAFKTEAVKYDYPYVKYFLKETIERFREIDKSGAYLPL